MAAATLAELSYPQATILAGHESGLKLFIRDLSEYMSPAIMVG